MIALLIDVDNFSKPAWIDEAIEVLVQSDGPIAIRRAYGSAENLRGLADVLRLWAIRPFINLPLPKNTTDVALAIDAMELACLTPRPKQMVIASGDMDFVPLVVRLRERGIKVVCVSERGKMAQDAISAYDQVIYVGADQVAGPATGASKTAPVVSPVKIAAPKPATAKGSDKATKASTTHKQIIKALPELRTGQWVHLSGITKKLRDQKVLAKSAASTKLFRQFPEHFELKPATKPNQVRYRA